MQLIDCEFSSRCAVKQLLHVAAFSLVVMGSVSPCLAADPPSNDATATVQSLPPDLPLPAADPNVSAWLREATILQPYGHSAYVALANPGERPEKLQQEFGFKVITVQPPDSHNTIARPADKLTEQQFRAALAVYRAAGYRVILYTSVMAL